MSGGDLRDFGAMIEIASMISFSPSIFNNKQQQHHKKSSIEPQIIVKISNTNLKPLIIFQIKTFNFLRT